MNPELQPEAPLQRRNKKERGTMKALIFLFIWLLLISGGIYGGKVYMENVKQEITTDVQRQTQAELTKVQAHYAEQIQQLETELKAELDKLQSQVQTFNELLTFANDSAKDETDNSNQLYTQLEAVKKQLNQLEENLEVLK